MEPLGVEEPLARPREARRPVALGRGGAALDGGDAANVPKQRVAEGDDAPRAKVRARAGVLAAQEAVREVVDRRVGLLVLALGRRVLQESGERRRVGAAQQDAVEAVREAERRPVGAVERRLRLEVEKRAQPALAEQPVVLQQREVRRRARRERAQHPRDVRRLPPRARHEVGRRRAPPRRLARAAADKEHVRRAHAPLRAVKRRVTVAAVGAHVVHRHADAARRRRRGGELAQQRVERRVQIIAAAVARRRRHRQQHPAVGFGRGRRSSGRRAGRHRRRCWNASRACRYDLQLGFQAERWSIRRWW